MELDRNADCPAQGKEFDPEEMRRCKIGGHTIIKQPDAIQISCPAACRFRRRARLPRVPGAPVPVLPAVAAPARPGFPRGRPWPGFPAVCPTSPAQSHVPPHRKVAAALSAAVTTAPKQENAPNSQGRASPKEASSLFPRRSSGVGVWGRGASLREAASPPESPHPLPLREGARGREPFFRKAPSLAKLYSFTI